MVLVNTGFSPFQILLIGFVVVAVIVTLIILSDESIK